MAEEAPKTTPAADKPEATPPAPAAAEGKDEPADFMTSARTLAEAAQAAVTQQTDKISKEKVAEAAENVLESAKSSGLDAKVGAGQYLDKAQGYLHQMHTGGEKDKKSEKEESGGDAPAGGGIMKMAQGFFK